MLMPEEKIIPALVTGGQANAGPPLGPALAPMGLNVMAIVSEINEKTVQQIYTGLSRARGDLIVISNQKSINQIKELL